MGYRGGERRRFFIGTVMQARFLGFAILLLVLYSLFLLLIRKLSTMLVPPFLFLIALTGLVFIILLPCMFFTHRIFGPLARIESHAKQMASRDLSNFVRLRRGDDETIRRLAECFNLLSQNLKEPLAEAQRIQALTQEKTACLASLLEEGKPYREDAAALMQEIQNLHEELDRILKGFKLF